MTHAKPAADEGTRSSSAGRLRERGFGFVFLIYKSSLSPLLHAISPSRCLYLPTCSEYAYTAISRFGVIRGSWMALRRFARCHPWGKGGLDPVPDLHPANSFPDRRATPFVSSKSGQKHADHLP